ncbi:MAG: glycoside hydrolase family 97 protein [Saprospiraceae bacterium]
MRYLLFAISLLSLASCGNSGFGESEQEPTITSPDGALSVLFERSEAGEISYFLLKNGEELISRSSLGFSESGLGNITKDLSIEDIKATDGVEAYELPWGEVASVNAPFKEIQLSLKHVPTKFTFSVEARLFDDGLGLRYHFPAQANVNMESDVMQILEEHTQFNFPSDPLVNWGPGDWNSYENRLELTRLSEIDAKKYDDRDQLISRVVPNNAIMTPATLKLGNGTHLSIHEAALIDYPEMTLGVNEDGFESILAGSPNREAKAVRTLPFVTPWRTVGVEDRAIDFLANTLVLNLNAPNQLGDVSWFEPKTYAGVWWEMFLGKGTWDYGSGQSAAGSAGEAENGVSRHAANTTNVKQYIDFCADNNIEGLLVEGWNTGWEVWLDSLKRLDAFDFVTPYPDYDLREVVAYGKSKGVEIVMHHETSGVPERYEQQMDTAFALMQELGLHAVKSGYVGNFPNGEYHHGQYGSRHYRKAYETAAKYQVGINPHEPIKPTGERRTLPNAISAEGARGMEYNAFGDYTQVNQPSHLPSIVYTRSLAGPFDYTPGIFNLEMEGWKGEDDEVLSTLGKQLGAYVVIYAPIQMVADLPEHYRSPVDLRSTGQGVPTDRRSIGLDAAGAAYHVAMRRYIREMATDWDATYPLAGELGEYAVVARKVKGESRYFIGGIAGDKDQEIEVVLDFLEAGFSYELSLFSDAEDAHFRTNKTALDVVNSFVSKGDTLRVTMKQAGGFGGIIGAGVAE